MHDLPAIQLSLLQFFKSGKFDFIKLGDTKEFILNNCPPPDDYGLGTSLETAKIWMYGNIEFHFNELGLFLIYSDHLTELQNTDAVEMDKWILASTQPLSLQTVIEQLNIERVDFNKRTWNQFEECVILSLSQSKVELKFLSQDDNNNYISNPNLFQLYSFGLM